MAKGTNSLGSQLDLNNNVFGTIEHQTSVLLLGVIK